MVRFGVSNIYLKVGLALMVIGLVAGTWMFLQPASSSASGMLMWVARASFLGGIVLYVIGRLTQVVHRRSRA